ncbi:MAG: bacterial Ig-like domain-containing protein, partial [Oscillospiraceae bacterium]|nr:bacterial Ig-like domain-containing protein [Oscillospiraceae bacterium]
HFYDINLVLEAQVVQPDGTVIVKIRLADGVDPAKCKVYHVTDDIVNPLVRFANTIDGNYVVFETDHFSEFAVIEVETVLDSIEISNLPERTYYKIGEQLDLTGLKVTANLSDGTSKEVENFNVGMTDLNSVGTKKVTVYYTYGGVTKTAEFEVSVSNNMLTADIVSGGNSVERINKKLGIFELYTKASVQLGCVTENAEGCSLRWSSDNSKVLVDESGKVTCKGLFGAKKANITVEVIDESGNVVGKDTVTVVFYKLSFQLSKVASQAFSIIKHSFFDKKYRV